MIRKAWYIVAYDIADPKRLKRVHYRIKKAGISAQRSVFLVRGTENQVEKLLDRLAREMVLKDDDLRAYPIADPRKVWTTGVNPLAQFPTLHIDGAPEETRRKTKKQKTSKWLRWLFREK